LLTIVPPLPNRDGERAREALSDAGLPLFKAEIPRAVAFQRCILTGTTVKSDEYETVGREIFKLVNRTTR
jgi:chromosome partitioning protein